MRQKYFPLPKAEDLRNKFAGSDRFSVIDMNHAFHQFQLDKESKNMFLYYTSWGLYKYNILAMGYTHQVVSVRRS